MRTPRLSKKEQALIKGALRRVFSRSDLRRSIVAASIIQHTDPDRPRVTKWSRCPRCNQPTPAYLMEVDHIDPVVPIGKTLDDMTWDDLVDRLWCSADNLQATCKPCHKVKSKGEAKSRRAIKKLASAA